MTTTITEPTHERILRTAIPGPESHRLHERRQAPFSSSFSVTVPVYIERAGGGTLVDADGNQLIEAGLRVLEGSLAGAVIGGGADDPEIADVVAALEGQVGRVTDQRFAGAGMTGPADEIVANEVAS